MSSITLKTTDWIGARTCHRHHGGLGKPQSTCRIGQLPLTRLSHAVPFHARAVRLMSGRTRQVFPLARKKSSKKLCYIVFVNYSLA